METKAIIRNIIASVSCGYLTFKGCPLTGLGALVLLTDFKAFKQSQTQEKTFTHTKPSLQNKNVTLPILKTFKAVSYNDLDLTDTLQTVLGAYGIQAQVLTRQSGPLLTTYQVKLLEAIKLTKLLKLHDEIAISLRVSSVRIFSSPENGTISLEIPNKARQSVPFETIESQCPQGYALPISLGVDVSGKPIFKDLAKLPHVLVSGTTGSGKSVGVNAMLATLLQHKKPSEMRLVLIDPKRVELSDFQALPHLLCPVIVDNDKALEALTYCVSEMKNRYHTLSQSGTKNIGEHNAKSSVKMPYIVVIIDEFADLMLSKDGNLIETCVVKLAQKARACGIHLILATQRPTVDVVTGLIKANIVARLSYRVASKIDSRVVLDTQGAENLLGQGDALYMSPTSPILERIHSAFCSNESIFRLVSHWKAQGLPDYKPLNSFVDVEPSNNISLQGIQRALKVNKESALKVAKALQCQGTINNILK